MESFNRAESELNNSIRHTRHDERQRRGQIRTGSRQAHLETKFL